MSPRRPQEAKNEAQGCPRRGQKGPREGQNEPPEAPGARSAKIVIFGPPKVPPGTTLQHFWGCALRKKTRFRTRKVLYCRAFPRENLQILWFGCIFDYIFSAKPTLFDDF